METKHTPGPWFNDGGYGLYGRQITGNGGATPVCAIANFERPIYGKDGRLEGSEIRPEMRANALLISAAPELLAVVQELRESAGYWSEYDVPCGIVERMDAALAKALGMSSNK